MSNQPQQPQGPSSSDSIDLAGVVRIAWQRKVLLGGLAIACSLGAVALGAMAPTVYEGTVTLMVVDSRMGENPATPYDIATTAALLRGPSLVARTLDVQVLEEDARSPAWLPDCGEDYVWQRGNEWMLHAARSVSGSEVTLLALWDGRPAAGPGGAGDMVRLAEAQGLGVVVIQTEEFTRTG